MNRPIPIASFGQVEAGSLLWAHRGVLRLTVIVRAAYALVQDTPTMVTPGAVEHADVHYRSDTSRPLRTASDIAPYVPRAEVVHAGAVVAPAGITMARLALVRGGRTLLDKRVVASSKNDSPGLGPLAPASVERASLLHGRPLPAFDAHGVLLLADDFDFAFYQSAPFDQRVDAVLGGDEIVVANLHPSLAELVVTMPSRVPFARAVIGQQTAALQLACKRVYIDTDRRAYLLLFYGDVQLTGLAALPYLRVEAYAPTDPEPRITARPPLKAPSQSGSFDAVRSAPPASPGTVMAAPPSPPIAGLTATHELLNRIAGRVSSVPVALPGGMRSLTPGHAVLSVGNRSLSPNAGRFSAVVVTESTPPSATPPINAFDATIADPDPRKDG